MNSTSSRAAAWAAPLLSHLHATIATPGKSTHKLPAMPCVLWLPDFRTYVRSVDLLRGTFTTHPTAEGALRLGDDQAEILGQDLIDATGVRLHVRAYHQAHSGQGAH
nr:hypothetical protein [uncultured Roseateles sp.]